MAEKLLDEVILWVNDKEGDRMTEESLRQAGVEFKVKHVNVDSPSDPLITPSLQTHSFRYSGALIIDALVRSKDMPIAQIVEDDRELYLTKIRNEEEQGVTVHWPEWSVRHQAK